ncbi:hypothetical protein EV424DRAFT_1348496 [Suillus variegatus]|nr:hypothetical protein EV424DRAFT_1348496 [Suillus variegatus]
MLTFITLTLRNNFIEHFGSSALGLGCTQPCYTIPITLEKSHCSGGQTLALIAATTYFNDTIDFLFPSDILENAKTCLHSQWPILLGDLTTDQRKEYDNEVAELVADNTSTNGVCEELLH